MKPLTLPVLIHRDRRDEPLPGTLSAWVVQHGRRGPNLLAGRMLTSVDTARQVIEARLQNAFGACGCALTIEWTIEEGGEPKAGAA